MKSFIFSAKFLILTLAVLPLSLCSKDDDNETFKTVFEPIEITFENEPLKECYKGVTIDNIKISFQDADRDKELGFYDSHNNFECNLGKYGNDYGLIGMDRNVEYFKANGITSNSIVGLVLGYGYLEIDFSNLIGVKKITLGIDNQNPGETQALLYEEEIMVDRIKPEWSLDNYNAKNFVFDNISEKATHILVWSGEGQIFKMLFE